MSKAGVPSREGCVCVLSSSSPGKFIRPVHSFDDHAQLHAYRLERAWCVCVFMCGSLGCVMLVDHPWPLRMFYFSPLSSLLAMFYLPVFFLNYATYIRVVLVRLSWRFRERGVLVFFVLCVYFDREQR